MGDTGTCLGCGQGSPAGIRKQVQDLDRTSGFANPGAKPVPIGSRLKITLTSRGKKLLQLCSSFLIEFF